MDLFQFSVISLIGTYPRETLAFIHQETYEEMFRERVYNSHTSPNWKYSNSPSIEYINKL